MGAFRGGGGVGLNTSTAGKFAVNEVLLISFAEPMGEAGTKVESD